MKKFKGMVAISRSDGTGGSYMNIDLSDHDAAVHVVLIKLSFENFAKALTSMQVECDVELQESPNIGKKHEFKEEIVTIPGGYVTRNDRDDRSRVYEAVHPYLIDGWEPRLDDFFNHHRWVGDTDDKKGKRYRVSFYRWVEKDA